MEGDQTHTLANGEGTSDAGVVLRARHNRAGKGANQDGTIGAQAGTANGQSDSTVGGSVGGSDGGDVRWVVAEGLGGGTLRARYHYHILLQTLSSWHHYHQLDVCASLDGSDCTSNGDHQRGTEIGARDDDKLLA